MKLRFHGAICFRSIQANTGSLPCVVMRRRRKLLDGAFLFRGIEPSDG